MGNMFGIKAVDSGPGAIVTWVDLGSEAYKKGVRVNQLIGEIDGVNVTGDPFADIRASIKFYQEITFVEESKKAELRAEIEARSIRVIKWRESRKAARKAAREAINQPSLANQCNVVEETKE